MCVNIHYPRFVLQTTGVDDPGLDKYGLTKGREGDHYFPVAIVGIGE